MRAICFAPWVDRSGTDGVLESHTWGSRAPRLDRPDLLTFDLDPGPEVDWVQIGQAAACVRAVLQDWHSARSSKPPAARGFTSLCRSPPSKAGISSRISPAHSWKMSRAGNPTATPRLHPKQNAKENFLSITCATPAWQPPCAPIRRGRSPAPRSPCRFMEGSHERSARALYAISNVPDHLAGRGEDPWQDFEAARRPLTAKLLRRLK